MIVTESKLRVLTPQVGLVTEARAQTRYFSIANHNLSVFLSHKHDELEYLERVRYLLERLNTAVYVDWADPTMIYPPDRKTGEKLKEKIKKYDKFVFIASDAAIDSEWCNWEIGYGDAQKYDDDKIAIFPIKQDDRNWTGNEYLQLYPSIEYYDGTTRYSDTREIIKEGFYVKYHYNNNIIVPLLDWLNK
jgi:hypothetical protein